MSTPIKFRRVQSNSTLSFNKGDILFVWDDSTNGKLLICKAPGKLNGSASEKGVFEDYSNTDRITTIENQLTGLNQILESI